MFNNKQWGLTTGLINMVNYMQNIRVLSAAFICIMMTCILSIPVRSLSAELIHTIQAGSHSSEKDSQIQYEALERGLSEKDRSYLRIEKIGKYYAVRIGKFKNSEEVKDLMQTIKSEFPKTLSMTAYIKDARVVRMYEGKHNGEPDAAPVSHSKVPAKDVVPEPSDTAEFTAVQRTIEKKEKEISSSSSEQKSPDVSEASEKTGDAAPARDAGSGPVRALEATGVQKRMDREVSSGSSKRIQKRRTVTETSDTMLPGNTDGRQKNRGLFVVGIVLALFVILSLVWRALKSKGKEINNAEEHGEREADSPVDQNQQEPVNVDALSPPMTINACKEILKKTPGSAASHNDLGNAYSRAGMYKYAIEAYSQAIKLKSNYAEAYNNLGIACRNLVMFKDAVKANKKAIKLKPDCAEFWVNIGITYSQTGMHTEAVDSIKKAIGLNLEYAEAYNSLGTVYAKMGVNKESVLAFERAVRLKPDYAEACSNLGTAYITSGMNKDAIHALEKAVHLKPDYAEAHDKLGIAYIRLGMIEDAIEAHKQAVKIKPRYAEAHNNLGLAYSKSGMKGSAVEALKQAIRLKPNYSDARNNLERVQHESIA